jgi:hypothetical protein
MSKISIDEKLAKAASEKITRLEAQNAALCKALDEVMRRRILVPKVALERLLAGDQA